MKFVLTIQLGNEAMQTGDDVGRALREVSGGVDHLPTFTESAIGFGKRIMDDNGNHVGSWEVVR
jgi:hypothetical protein